MNSERTATTSESGGLGKSKRRSHQGAEQTPRPLPMRLRGIVAMGEMEEIKKNDFNLNISRYISTAVGETEIVLEKVHDELTAAETAIREKTKLHNTFLKELGLHLLPRP